MRRIKYITIHCTAGYGTIASIKKFWHEKLGWKIGGYHRIVDLDAKIYKLYDFSVVTNGVKGFNSESIHISYTGGVERDNVNKAKDSRTAAQKEALISCIEEALLWCNKYQEIDGIIIQGHRDFSVDKNGNGVIDAWERIKECPSYNAIDDYWWMMGSKALNALNAKRKEHYWLQKTKILNG